ncbi:uncharacterized protein LOC123712646 isoform X1 [Pieris brassicae]|uniref:uncharacterized protein LOC123712646 isoform X1 n=1 Tax=Pieris brassicae TaxID=7116 RepID=UPI001E65ECF9|nr:uncharacterized protein LOC123712646 isoform X1 [Pieris brassicae]
MYYKLYLFFAVSVIWMYNVNAMPRDSSVINTDSVSGIPETNLLKDKEPTEESVVTIPGQVLCKYDKGSEEPSEDVVCQEHCLPKGYSYGICVSGKCSCI